MMDTREQLQQLLSEYVEDTLNYIQTARDFCDEQQKWTLQRKTELEEMKGIKHSESALRSGITQFKAESKYKKLEKQLGGVLMKTLEGLEKLDHFLDALEKLRVTSLFVFSERSFMPEGVSPESVQSVITAARIASPLLIHFKRNAKTFFLPSLSNLGVLVIQLDKYIHITKQICERMGEKSKCVLWFKDIKRCKKGKLNFSLNLSEDSMQNMLDHLKQLCKIRMDQNIRLTFIFQEHALHFIGVFSQRCSRMEQFLSNLEESAVQLDRMKMGASISTVAGSSVGVTGGVLSIVGLALAPITAGVSLALTLTGLGLGVTSGVNSLVTGITEAAVNRHHGKNAQSIFQSYMDDVGKIIGCLEQASSEKHLERLDTVNVFLTGGKVIARVIGVANGIKDLVDVASAVNVLKSEEVIASAVKAGLQEVQNTRSIPKLAAELPDIGQLAKGTPLALTKSARAGFITLNALFIGIDVLFICKDSISLAKGSKSETSQLIRSRAALWKSELEAWQKIHDSLCIGILRFSKSQEVLEQHFVP